jgi:hypothetical protein
MLTFQIFLVYSESKAVSFIKNVSKLFLGAVTFCQCAILPSTQKEISTYFLLTVKTITIVLKQGVTL